MNEEKLSTKLAMLKGYDDIICETKTLIEFIQYEGKNISNSSTLALIKRLEERVQKIHDRYSLLASEHMRLNELYPIGL